MASSRHSKGWVFQIRRCVNTVNEHFSLLEFHAVWIGILVATFRMWLLPPSWLIQECRPEDGDSEISESLITVPHYTWRGIPEGWDLQRRSNFLLTFKLVSATGRYLRSVVTYFHFCVECLEHLGYGYDMQYVNSSFRCGVNTIFDLLGCYSALMGSSLTAWRFKMRPKGFPETSVTNYQ